MKTTIFKSYYAPTPLFWRKIGDGMLAISTAVTGYAIATEYKWIAIASLATGTLGKFLTNFFTDANGGTIVSYDQFGYRIKDENTTTDSGSKQ